MPSVFIVTGASRGIGRSIVNSLLNSNLNPIVIGISRSKTPLEELASENANFKYVLGDTTDDSINKTAVELAISKYGRLDGIVLNAGVLEPVSKLADASIEEWKRLYDVNVFSIISLLKHSIPHLRHGGRAVFVSSGAATGHYGTWGAYGSSKASVNHIAATLAVEEPKIFSISIAPGVVDTQMQVNIREQHGKTMFAENHKKFTDLKASGGLLSPDVPGAVIANLVARSGPTELNGGFYRYDSDALKEFQS